MKLIWIGLLVAFATAAEIGALEEAFENNAMNLTDRGWDEQSRNCKDWECCDRKKMDTCQKASYYNCHCNYYYQRYCRESCHRCGARLMECSWWCWPCKMDY